MMMTRLLFLALLVGCPGTDTDTEVDTDSGADTDSEADTSDDIDTEIDTDTEVDTDTDTSDFNNVTAIIGERCLPHQQIAEVSLQVQGPSVSLNGVVWSDFAAIPPTATLSADGCSYYTFDPNICGDCASGDVCMPDGVCVERRAGIEASTLTVTVDGVETTVPNSGGFFYGNNVGSPDDAFNIDLAWGDITVSLDSVSIPAAVTGLQAVASGNWDTPGIISMTWDAGSGEVFTDIPMNHHVRTPAFTRCHASVSAGNMTASAPMINPLAQVTGLEFQGFMVEIPAAAQTTDGCVQFTVGMQDYAGVSYPRALF
jgi:hypothetical protein